MLEYIICFGVALVLCLAFALTRKGGPVCRNNFVILEKSANDINHGVMLVLQNGQSNYRYTNTVCNQNGLLVETRVRPYLWPMMLSTAMKIRIEPIDGRCRLNVSTCSQKFITGDMFGCYDKYINDFISSVKKVTNNAEPAFSAEREDHAPR
jgi:hypothetical protein